MCTPRVRGSTSTRKTFGNRNCTPQPNPSSTHEPWAGCLMTITWKILYCRRDAMRWSLARTGTSRMRFMHEKESGLACREREPITLLHPNSRIDKARKAIMKHYSVRFRNQDNFLLYRGNASYILFDSEKKRGAWHERKHTVVQTHHFDNGPYTINICRGARAKMRPAEKNRANMICSLRSETKDLCK